MILSCLLIQKAGWNQVIFKTSHPSTDNIHTMETPFTSILINGQYQPSSTGDTFDVVNPFSQAVVGRAASASSEDCLCAIEAATNAFKTWGDSPFILRREIFLRAADLMASDKYKDLVTKAIAEETAAVPGWAMFNWGSIPPMLRAITGILNELKGDTVPSGTGGQVMAVRKPKGVW